MEKQSQQALNSRLARRSFVEVEGHKRVFWGLVVDDLGVDVVVRAETASRGVAAVPLRVGGRRRTVTPSGSACLRGREDMTG